MCASGSLFSIRPGTLGATIQGVTGCFYEELYSDFYLSLPKGLPVDEVQLIPYYLSMLFVRPGQARAEAGTMSSLENYKWVYLAFQRRLRVTRISRYGYRGIFIVMSSHDPALQPYNSILPWSKPGPLYQVFFPA